MTKNIQEVLENSNTTELIYAYSTIIKKLKELKVIRSNNLIGDLGEYLAIEHFNNTPGLPNLEAASVGTRNIDAISKDGERYSIKSATSNSTGVFYGLELPDSDLPDTQKFEYVLVMKFDKDFQLEKIIQLDWNLFLKHKRWHKRMKAWSLSITRNLISEAEVLFEIQPN